MVFMKRKNPPRIKIYESLGCIADGRIKVDGNSAKVWSSSGNKYYTVKFDPSTMAIMSNDNWSYRQGYLGYPSIAYLMVKKYIEYSEVYGERLRWIARKDINTLNHNNYDKTIAYVDDLLMKMWVNIERFKEYQKRLEKAIADLNLSLLWEKAIPPTAY